MGCKFCDLPFDNTFPKDRELSLVQWTRILRELKEWSPLVREVYVSGGEPFLRPDMIEILEQAYQLGINTRMSTIGAFCSQAICDRLLQSPVKWLKFSIHSGNAAIHDALVGRRVFAKVVEAIKYLKSHGYRGNIGILTTIFSGNVADLGSVVRLAQELHVDSVYFRPLFGNTRAVRVYGEPVLSEPSCIVHDASALQAAIDEMKELRNKGAPIVNTDRQLDLIVKQNLGLNEGLPGCKMMYESIYIRPDGTVEVCGHMSLGSMGNVASKSVSEVLSSNAAYQARHIVSRKCQCQGNAFVCKTFADRLSIIIDILRG